MVEESKRFGLSLDARDRDAGRQSRTPHGQILRYLSTADIESESRIRWGFLTNGGLWRLYDYRARPRATGYFEADLGEMLASGGEDGLRLFYLLFRRDSFTPQQGATTSFLEAALAQGRRYEEKVAQDLSSVVFERVFPKLVQALADSTGEDLSRVRHAALILPLSTALRALRRGPRAAPGERPAIRGLRFAEVGARPRGPQDARQRRLLRQRLQLLRPPVDAVPPNRRGRRVHRSAALQRRPVCLRSRAIAQGGSPYGQDRRRYHLRPEPHGD